ncbi:MAG: hypothetical protein Q7R62_00795 [bacterium]|nr:hypothetical protein [bacterium]
MALQLSAKKIGDHWAIVNGPSKFDLMVALFYGSGLEKTRPEVTFEIGAGGETRRVSCIINSISREDGSGESWNIQGYTPHEEPWMDFRAYFTTSVRQGHIRFSLI